MPPPTMIPCADATAPACARGVVLKSFRESAYYRAMGNWLRTAGPNWDALLAILLVYAVVAIYLGPGWYFLVWYVCLCGYVIRVALKR